MVEEFGYKGFKLVDGKLTCLSMTYEPGKTYVFDGKIKICSRGYHYCQELKHVNDYYSFTNNDVVVYKVKASGDIQRIDNKSVCSQIEILEEVPIKTILLKETLDKFLKYQESHNAVLGGSTALILLGLLPNKKPGDLDIIIPVYKPFDESTFISEALKSGSDVCTTFMDNGTKVDVFLNPYITYKVVNFEGVNYNVALPDNIIKAKVKYFFTNSKHKNELIEIFKNYKH